MTFLAHETLHMSYLDPTKGILCVRRAQDPLGGRREALGDPGGPWGVNTNNLPFRSPPEDCPGARLSVIHVRAVFRRIFVCRLALATSCRGNSRAQAANVRFFVTPDFCLSPRPRHLLQGEQQGSFCIFIKLTREQPGSAFEILSTIPVLLPLFIPIHRATSRPEPA